MHRNTRSGVGAALLILGILLPAAAAGAVGDHQWSRGFGAAGAAAVDDAGNVVVHGAFFGTVDFGGGPLTAANVFDGDQYLARFDAAGNHLWSMQFTPTGFGASNERVAVDPAGNILIAGRTANGASVDFGGGALPGGALYVAAFDPDGHHLWSAGFGDGQPTDLAADGSLVAVAGYTTAGVDFGGGTVGAAGGNDAVVGVLTAAGGHAWSAGFGDAADDQGAMAVAFDGAGGVLLACSQFGTVDYGGGPLTANGLDLVLARFDAAGAHLWSRLFDGTFTPGGGILVTVDVAGSPSGGAVAAGEVVGGVDFGGGTLTSNGFGDAFVASFDAAGNHVWSAVHGSSGQSDHAAGVAVDADGNVAVAGTFGDDADFGGGVIPLNGDPLSFNRNMFLAVYDDVGGHLHSAGYGLTVYEAGVDMDGAGDLLVFGGGFGGIDLGGGTLATMELFVGMLEGEGGGPTSATGDVPRAAVGHLRAAPNPFNPTTVIAYELARAGRAAVSVYDVRGGLVARPVPERWHAAGPHRVRFQARASGVYLVRLHTAAGDVTLKTVAVK